MMSTVFLLGIYFVSVATVYGLARYKRRALGRLPPIVIVGLFSFVPGLALGRALILRTDLWDLLSRAPTWLSAGLSVLIIVGTIPARRGIRKNVLDRAADNARHFQDKLPERLLAIEAAENRGETTIEKASKRKTQILREADRKVAIDGVGRFLYVLLKLHLVRVSLQVLGVVAIALWEYGSPFSHAILEGSTMFAVDGVFVSGPYMIVLYSLTFFGRSG